MYGLNGIKGYTIEQLMTEWGCSRQSIWRWISSGELPAPITLGRRRKFWPAHVIEAFLARKLKDAQRASQPQPAAIDTESQDNA
jgi:predicted DNA-binding transcriptional regulator AlpA